MPLQLPGQPPAPFPPPNDPRIRRRPGPDRWARDAGFQRIAGVDEAGRGPWAGPVVAAAVVVRRRLPVRIDDSKRLTPLQRARAFQIILERSDVGFGIACAAQIDRHNILRASLLAMQEAIADLPESPDVVMVDGPIPPACTVPCWPLIGGDRRSYVIGCASIMAKVLRDRMMVFYHRLASSYSFHLHKGYGTDLHAARLRSFGPSIFHRRSFRPVMDRLAETARVAASDVA